MTNKVIKTCYRNPITVSDPLSFYADPDPALLGDADPYTDPDPGEKNKNISQVNCKKFF